MKYAYQRQGGPILSWNRAAPQQTRAADAKALGCGCTSGLGSLGGDSLDAMPLPVPGGPEPIGTTETPGVSAAIGRVIDRNRILIGFAAAMYVHHKFFKKKK